MLERLKTMRWLMLVSGILCIVVGISVMATPFANLLGLAVFISICMLISGFSEVASYFSEDKEYRSGWVLTGGIITLLVALWLLFGHGTAAIAAVIPFVFAVWVLVSGITRAVGAFSLKSYGAGNWGWVLAAGILEAVLGGLMMFYPLLSVTLISAVLAMMFISHGISDIAVFAGLTKAKKFINKFR